MLQLRSPDIGMRLGQQHSHTLEFSIVDFGSSIENRCSIENRQYRDAIIEGWGRNGGVGWLKMQNNVCNGMTLLCVTFLGFGSAAEVCAGPLREEAVAYRRQGYETQQRGDAAEALSWYQKAAALDPSYPTAQNDIGVIFEQQGRLEEAERAYRKAVELNPQYPEAHANLAMLYERMGDEKSATVHWLKRYELGDPSDPWTARAEDRLKALGFHQSPASNSTHKARARVMDEAFKQNARTVEDFHSVTRRYSDWP